MSVAIAITTAPRPIETLTVSIKSLRRAGFEQPVVINSDGSCPNFDDCTTVINTPPLGGLKNWCYALEHLVETTSDSWLMIVEDDVTWAKSAAAALRSDLKLLDARNDVGYLSLYLSRKVSREIEKRKLRRLTPGMYKSELGAHCWGSQAYAIPRATAVALLRNEVFDDYRRNYVKNRNRDNIISGCLTAMKYSLFYRVPCLVNHTLGSANSSLRNKPIQPALLTDYWTGKP